MANVKGVKIVTTITSKKLTGGRSKYGGGRNGLIKANPNGEWYCQSCGLAHPPSDSPYMFEFSEGEFIRICNKCLWLARANHIVDFLILRELVKRSQNKIR